MSHAPSIQPLDKVAGSPETIPPLEQGDRLDQPTFHARYEAMPAGHRAELIGGTVFMPSPAKRPHSRTTGRVSRWLGIYEDHTPGTEMHDNGSNLMGPESEPHPDTCLLISSACGGQTSVKDEWIVGAPELIGEIASSTESIDLHGKKADYERAGVKEYIVLALRQQRVYWFINQDEEFVELSAGEDGLFRSTVFPGLWLDPAALLAGNMARVYEVLAAGLASPEHGAFVARLQATRPEGTS
jgi:Uma2 family endonuclease